ncbi:MAG TPA: SUMF1/EgtB/PvdO family nonheme iron enzyme [Blastocatellia bacterium]|nr:SUMF1/EgtB/PvdO family nonheme iron enzyme [Blastocatellia bacterium]
MIRILSIIITLAVSLPGFAQVSTKPNSDRPQLMNFAPAEGASRDAATGLPTRIVHKASGIVFVLIPAGEFQMGSPTGEPDRGSEERQHRRIIKKPFYLGETEVIVEQFRRFAQETGYKTDAERGVEDNGHWKGSFATTPEGPDARDWTETASWRNPFPHVKEYRMSDKHPVVHVSWNDAERFVEHFGLQLPTEAQWEYAARAGSRTRFFWGDAETGGEGYANVADATGRKRFKMWNLSFAFDDGVAMISDVGKYRPNGWKLYDMMGNVSEWCQDAYGKNYPNDGADDTAIQGESNAPRIMRGSSWLDAPDANRSAKRFVFTPTGRRDFIGFRVAATIESVK